MIDDTTPTDAPVQPTEPATHPLTHPLTTALRDLLRAAEAIRREMDIAAAAATTQLPSANKALRAILASGDIVPPFGLPLGPRATDVTNRVASNLTDLARLIISLPDFLASHVRTLQEGGADDPAHPVLRLRAFRGAVEWSDPRGPDYPVPFGSDSNFAVCAIDGLDEGHPAKTLCGPDEWVIWPGIGPALVYGPRRPFVDFHTVRAITTEWRRMMDHAAQQREYQRRAEERDRQRLKDPLARIADLEAKLGVQR
jgi:hypothetical protein